MFGNTSLTSTSTSTANVPDTDTEPHFAPVLDPVQVPPGYYPIQVVQFWRGEYARGRPYPLHWTILVRTSADRGNTHEIVGDTHTFATQDHFDVPLPDDHRREDWRGSHVVGYVAPARLDDLLNRIALVRVVHQRANWNCQNWVCEALEGMDEPDMYTDASMTLARLQAHMFYLLELWETGDI